MKACLLNHDLSATTGAGRFGRALISALRNGDPRGTYDMFTHEDVLPRGWWGSLIALPRLRRLAGRYNVIHALDGWPYGVLAAFMTAGTGRKLVITAIGTGAVQPLYNFIRRLFLHWAYQRADALTAVSRHTRTEILKVVSGLVIEVINHGVNADSFKAPPSSLPEIEKLKPYILSVGALKSRKGFDTAIEACARWRKRFPSLRYLIFGTGPEYERLRELAETNGVGRQVIFVAYDTTLGSRVDEATLVALYRNAELFLLLPRDVGKDIEGFGLVFLEAAASGLPVVATRDSSAEDAVSDGESGVLVPSADPVAAAEAIAAILSRPDLRRRFSRNAIAFAAARNWRIVAERYRTVYHKVLAQ